MINEKPIFKTMQRITKTYGISSDILRRWEKQGHIKSARTPGNTRMFRITDIEQMLSIDRNNDNRKRYIYCRVSSSKQRDDLLRQRKFLEQKYPTYDIIEDIGSGINFTRKGIKKILDEAMQGNIEEIVISYKDRLTRFGFELFEYIIQQNGGKITVINNEEFKSCEQELSEDLLSIIHVFNCKQMGKRRYSNKKLQNKTISES